MYEISENQTDEYEMEGMFAEVFFALQVFWCSPHSFTKITIPKNFKKCFTKLAWFDEKTVRKKKKLTFGF